MRLSLLILSILFSLSSCHAQRYLGRTDYNEYHEVISDTLFSNDTIVEQSIIAKKKKEKIETKSISIYGDKRILKKRTYWLEWWHDQVCEYDSAGRLVRATRFSNDGQLNSFVEYAYHGDSIIAVASTFERSSRNIYLMDSKGRIREEIGYLDGKFFYRKLHARTDYGVFEHTYLIDCDVNGAPTDTTGSITWNAELRQEQHTYYDDQNHVNYQYTITLDKKGRMIERVNVIPLKTELGEGPGVSYQQCVYYEECAEYKLKEEWRYTDMTSGKLETGVWLWEKGVWPEGTK